MRVILLGDSITQGLGSKKINFVGELEKLLSKNDTIYNLAMTGTVINYTFSLFDQINSISPDYAVIVYGNVDAMLKPNRKGKVFEKLPRRFKINNGSMLLPRPFYSRKWYKKIGQLFENSLRTIFRKLIFKVDGTEQWMPFDQFVVYYSDLCSKLKELQIKPVLCSTVYIDDKLFPGSVEEYQKYNDWLRNYSSINNYVFIDLFQEFKRLVLQDGWLKYYNYDHFHPNGNGYLIMAHLIAEAFHN